MCHPVKEPISSGFLREATGEAGQPSFPGLVNYFSTYCHEIEQWDSHGAAQSALRQLINLNRLLATSNLHLALRNGFTIISVDRLPDHLRNQ
jgi:hypothetical protein